MPRRTIEVNGERWAVYPSGRVTAYDRDEFGLIFERGTGSKRTRRVTRYSPQGARRPDRALAELTEATLRALFDQSQPDWTSPETRYAATDG